MGLDQTWLYSQKTRNEVDKGAAPDFTSDEAALEGVVGAMEELYYHRKVPALEQFMANLAKDKGFEDVFNCTYVQVTEKDLDELAGKVERKSLDHNASGFFWGSHYDDDYDDIKSAIDAARAKLEEGHYIYYSSWW